MKIRNSLSLVVVAASVLFSYAAAHAESLWIKAKTATLRSAPEFYAESLLDLSHGDEVTKLSSEQKGWVKVSAGGYEGYIPVSAITTKDIALSDSPAEQMYADSSDVALAGKGIESDGTSGSRVKPLSRLPGRLGGF